MGKPKYIPAYQLWSYRFKTEEELENEGYKDFLSRVKNMHYGFPLGKPFSYECNKYNIIDWFGTWGQITITTGARTSQVFVFSIDHITLRDEFLTKTH